jgi:hypothetical protein
LDHGRDAACLQFNVDVLPRYIIIDIESQHQTFLDKLPNTTVFT